MRFAVKGNTLQEDARWWATTLYTLLTAACHLGALVFCTVVTTTSSWLMNWLTCRDGVCVLGVFTTHMHHTSEVVYALTVAATVLNGCLLLVLFARAVSPAALAESDKRLPKFLRNALYVTVVTLSALACGAIFGSDFIMLTANTDESPGALQLRMLKQSGVALFAFQFAAYCAEAF